MQGDLAAGAGAIADPARAAMLDALMDGAPHSAGALAREAGVAASTASHHLARLLDAGLIVVEPDGRRRAFRLARPEVAQALEALSLVCPPRRARTLRAATRAQAERAARTCYDHLAGRLGVAIGLRPAVPRLERAAPSPGRHAGRVHRRRAPRAPLGHARAAHTGPADHRARPGWTG